MEPGEERPDTRPELTVLVLLRDQLQKLRIAEGNRAGAAEKLGEGDRAALHTGYSERILDLEEEITRAVRDEVRAHPAWPWLSGIRGVAETSAGLVLGHIDIGKCPHVSSLWKFAGYGVTEGHRDRPVKGQKLSYNARLKTMVWRLIDLQVKTRGPYRRVYDQAKHGYVTTRMEPESARKVLEKLHRERADAPEEPEAPERAADYEEPIERERAVTGQEPTPFERAAISESPDERERAEEPPETGYWTLGHCEQAARRKAAKLFLSHLWQVWREAEGLPVGDAYVIGKGEHHEAIDPWEFVGAVR